MAADYHRVVVGAGGVRYLGDGGPVAGGEAHEGRTLAQTLAADGPFPPAELARLGALLARQAAVGRPPVLADLPPTEVWLVPDPDGGERPALTRAASVGALGGVLHWMAVGSPPEGAPQPLQGRTEVPVPASIEEAIRRARTGDVAERWSDPGALADALEAWSAALPASATPAPKRVSRPRRGGAVVAVIGAAVAAVAMGLAVAGVGAPVATTPQPTVAPTVRFVDEVSFSDAEAEAVLAWLNRTSEAELVAAGVYQRGAAEIVAARPLRSIEAFGAVRGVGTATVRAAKAAADGE